MPKYKLVLFDMDGTIANTDEMVVLSFLELFDKYGKGRHPTREELYYFSGPPLFESLKKLFPDTRVVNIVFETPKINPYYKDIEVCSEYYLKNGIEKVMENIQP